MDANYSRALSAVLKHEGGYVDHPKDPGGATNLGITIGTLSNWLGRKATKAEVKALTVDQAGRIYRSRYWNKVNGDALPAGLDLAVFDFAVNSGPARAAKMLQTIVGVTADGQIGPKTLAAIERIGAASVIGDLCSQRLAFLQQLSTWPTFGKGWGRRVADVRAEALAMAQAKPAEPSKPIPAPDAQAKPKSPLALLVALLIGLGAALVAFLKSNGVLP